MTHGSLFSGIGGFDLAAEWMGWENVFHCEWNTFGQKVLHHYWPNAISYHDITKTDFTIHRGRIDILTGGFPCQPYSTAGKRLGKEDERHLWPEMLRAIRQIQPRWIVGENVLGLVNWNGGMVFHEVQTDLEAEGYEVQPYVLPAAAVNAPHRRDRVWFVAYRQDMGFKGTFTELREGNQNSERASCEHKGRWNDIRPIIDGHGKSWFTPNPDSIGSNRIEKSERSNNEGGQSESSKQSRNGWASEVERYGKMGPTAHPNSDGQQWSDSQYEKHAGEGWEYAQRDTQPGIGDGDVADTDSKRYEKCEFTTQPNKQSGQHRKKNTANKPGSWENFPTQSPVCDGNDGLSSRLDGITFSKWRQESIKAGGNAVVPQVVYQIFQAIQEYENNF